MTTLLQSNLNYLINIQNICTYQIPSGPLSYTEDKRQEDLIKWWEISFVNFAFPKLLLSKRGEKDEVSLTFPKLFPFPCKFEAFSKNNHVWYEIKCFEFFFFNIFIDSWQGKEMESVGKISTCCLEHFWFLYFTISDTKEEQPLVKLYNSFVHSSQ